MYKYSIIVPVYNIQTDYLTKCLSSIEKQTYEEFECILVNNGSIDRNVTSFLEK
jgi:glycosyltransferase involved in cell wall biosynthesis